MEGNIDIQSTQNLDSLFSIIEGSGSYQEKTVIIEQAIESLSSRNLVEQITPYLTRYLASHPNDPFESYYRYLVASMKSQSGQEELASFYYEWAIKAPLDVEIKGKSVQFKSIQKVLNFSIDPSLRIELLNLLLSRFPKKIDHGLINYQLAKAYEENGDYQESFAAYRHYLAFPGTQIPGKVNEEQRVRELLSVSQSNPEWTRTSLDRLVSEVRSALSQKDTIRILELQAKVNFFSMSWLQEKADFNSQVSYDLKRFIENSSQLYFANGLDANSNSQEAYLKTWGWNAFIPTWFLYFRKINFPADPEINGNWEWAGIFFGDSLQ